MSKRFILSLLPTVLLACADQRGNPTPTPTPAATPVPPLRTWVTGDTHMHSHGCFGSPRLQPEQLLQQIVDANINVGSVLVWGEGFSDEYHLLTGADHNASRPGHILHYDLEVSRFAAEQTGHLVLLGLRSIQFSHDPFRQPATGVPIVDWAIGQDPRVLVGMAHSFAWPIGGLPTPDPRSCCIIPIELPVHVARGKLHFLEIDDISDRPGEAISAGAAFIWSMLQNAGYRIPLTAGTDTNCIHDRVGAVRTHVQVDGALADLNYEKFLNGIRAGRTVFAIDRASLHASVTAVGSVESVGIGEELRIRSGTPVDLQIELDQPLAENLTVTVNGVPTVTLAMIPGRQTLTTQLVLERSSWIALRTSTLQSSAIYVLVDDQPIRSAEAACYFMRVLDHTLNLVARNAFPNGRVDVAVPAYYEARNNYLQLFREGGGTSCP